MTNALILGANGFCARHLARALGRMTDVEVIGADLAPSPSEGALCGRYFELDVGDADSVCRVVKDSQPDWVFNLIGVSRGTDEDLYRVNVLGSINVLEAVRKLAPGARLLTVGSAAEYGIIEEAGLPVTEEHPCKPVGGYGASKYAATLASLSYAHRYGLRVVVARPFNMVGPGLPSTLVVGAILRRAREALAGQSEPVVKIGNLDTERDFVAVEDVADGLVAMIQGEHWGEVFNICSGRARPIREVIELTLSHASRAIRLEVDPDLIRPADARVVYGSYAKANRAFGFHPSVDLEDCLEAAWRYEMERDE